MKVQSILGLPLDVLHLIVNDETLEEDPDDLLNLRLVHSAFRDIAGRKTLERISITFDDEMDPDYREMVVDLLISPAYAIMRNCVKTLTLSIEILDQKKTSSRIFERFITLHGQTLLRCLTDRSFGRLENIFLRLECGEVEALHTFGGPDFTDVSGIFDIFRSLSHGPGTANGTAPCDCPTDGTGIANRATPHPRIHIRVIGAVHARSEWIMNCLENIPPADTLGVDTHGLLMQFLAPALDNSPNVTELDISEFSYFSPLGRLLERLKTPEALARVTRLRLVSKGGISVSTDISRFRSLKKLQILPGSGEEDMESHPTNFPWTKARENGIQLEHIDVNDMNEAFVEYLSWLPENSLEVLESTFDIPTAIFDAPPEDLEANSNLAATFWKAIARFQGSLKRLIIEPHLNRDDQADDDMNFIDNTCALIRIDAYLPWSPTSREFEEANISFQRLGLWHMSTAFMHDLDAYKDYTYDKYDIINESGVDPTEFRFDRVVKAIAPSLGKIRILIIRNICGVYDLGERPLGSEFDPHIEWEELSDNTDSLAHMAPVIEGYRFDGVPFDESAIGKTVIMLQAAVDTDETERRLYVLKNGDGIVHWKETVRHTGLTLF